MMLSLRFLNDTADLIEKYSVLPGLESIQNQESEKSPKEIIIIKKEQGEEKQDLNYSIRSTDKVDLEEFDLKSALFKHMNKIKSANRNPANYHLYHALMEALIADEDAMDKEVKDKVKDHKRKHDSDDDEDDDDDEGPSAGSNQGDKEQRIALSISKLKAARYLDFGLEELVPSLWVESEREYDISAVYGITHWWFRRKEFYINKHSESSDREAVRSQMRILSVISVKVFEKYGYNYLREIILRRADYQEYKISEKDFKNLHPNDFEDLFLLNIQEKLNHLPKTDKTSLHTAVNMWIRNLDAADYYFKEDYTIVPKPRAVVYRDRNDQRKLMRLNELHKFSDGTLTRVMEKLDHMVKDFHLYEYNKGMETRKWSEDDKRRSKDFITAIEKRLQIRRIYRSLESFVGGRIRDIDYRLINRTTTSLKDGFFHNEAGTPARSQHQNKLGSNVCDSTRINLVTTGKKRWCDSDHLKMEMEMEIPVPVKASANSDVMYFFTSVQDGDPSQDDQLLPSNIIYLYVCPAVGSTCAYIMANVNIPANYAPIEQAPAIATPTRTDYQILPLSKWVPIGKSNCVLDAPSTTSSTILGIIQQFWDTMCFDHILAPPSSDTVIEYVNTLGYPNTLRNVSAMSVNALYKPWRAICLMIKHCALQAKLLDMTGQDFQKNLATAARGKKKTVHLLILSVRFTKLIIHHLRTKHNIHPRTGLPLYYSHEESILNTLKFVRKDGREIFGMPIPDALLTDEIKGAPYYGDYQQPCWPKYHNFLDAETWQRLRMRSNRGPSRRVVLRGADSGKDQQFQGTSKGKEKVVDEYSMREGPVINAGDQDKGQARPNPGIQDEGQAGPNPGIQNEGQARSNPGNAAES
ncbi:hypothetical protein Tco_0013321 [Tanacetum coccineum]